MKLHIARIAAGIVLSFTVPGAGSFYVWTGLDHATILASGYELNACHVALLVPTNAPAGIFHLTFFPAN